tara:strand:- start:2561 stop:2812 length:252 start_codon:yes stop_codon:yes gene_type:complete
MNVELDTTYLVWVGVVFLIFVLREVNCWYWKVNKYIALQEQSNANQLKIIEAINNIETLKLPMHYNCRTTLDKRTCGAINKGE